MGVGEPCILANPQRVCTPHRPAAASGYNRVVSPNGRESGARLSLKKFKNPFYTLLIPVGLVFVLTVFAYGFMAFMEVNATKREVRDQANHPLFTWLDANGTRLVLWELGILGVLTVGAIATDSWWTNETASLHQQSSED
jgi:hypothetical protein